MIPDHRQAQQHSKSFFCFHNMSSGLALKAGVACCVAVETNTDSQHPPCFAGANAAASIAAAAAAVLSF
jgi:hypothetical protein